MSHSQERNSQSPPPITETSERVWTKPQIRVMTVSFSTRDGTGLGTASPENPDLSYGEGLYQPTS